MDKIHHMSRGRKTLLTLLVLGLIGTVAGIGTFSAFSATTVNAGNTFDAGTVVISDNDAGSAMYNIVDATPNQVVTRCIRVTYTGTLPSLVRLYTTTPVNAFGQYVTLSVDKGNMPAATAFSELRRLHVGVEHLLRHAVQLRRERRQLRDRRCAPTPVRRPSGT